MQTATGTQPILHITGDVNEPIDTDRAVRLDGSVGAGGSIEAGGSIAVGGAVVAGAVLSSREDVAVADGIAGATTQVFALGQVQARHIDQSQAHANGDIAVGGWVARAQVRSGARLKVDGAIVGGTAYAATRVQAASVGDSSGEHTVVGIVADLEMEARLTKVREGLEFCKTDILRIFRTLDLQTIRQEQIAALMARTPVGKRKYVIDILKKLNQLVQLRQKLVAKETGLLQQHTRALEEAEIEVSGKVYTGTQIRFGETALDIARDLDGPRFCLTDEGIVQRP